MSIPILPVQDAYYLRKIRVNVFSVHDLKQIQSNSMFGMKDGKKGPNEVSSFIADYVKNELTSEIKILK